MKKILYVITKSNWGGAQRYVYDLATSLSASEYAVIIACGHSADSGGLVPRITDSPEARHISTALIPAFGRDVSVGKDIAAFVQLYRLFTRERPDIVHLNSSKAGGVGALAARLAGVKNIVFTAHGWPFFEERPRAVRAAIKIASWFTVILAHSTITLCERDTHAFDGWMGTAGKITKIYNGIASGIRNHDDARLRLTAWGVREDLPLVGTIAEMHRNKGISYLIEAAALTPQVALCIIGDGEERAALEELVQKLGVGDRVFMPGFVPNAAETILSGFDIFALASIKEGLPYVLLEAGVRGLPVITTATGGTTEIVSDQKSGLVVRPKDASELARAIAYMADYPDDAQRFGEALREHVRTSFSPDTMVSLTLNRYRS